MRDGPLLTLVSLLPRRWLTRGLGLLAALPLRPVLPGLLRGYCRVYGVDLSELDRPLPGYRSFQEFFTRPLLAGARPLGEAALLSPVDGRVHRIGEVVDGAIEQAPGQLVPVVDFDLGWQPSSYAVLYLSPADYHRVHAPGDARLLEQAYRPGSFWPVFDAATRRVPRLFARNERLVLRFDRYTLVLVAAFGVGTIRTCWEGGAPQVVQRGQEIAVFELGSTVIVFAGETTWLKGEGERVRMGEDLGASS